MCTHMPGLQGDLLSLLQILTLVFERSSFVETGSWGLGKTRSLLSPHDSSVSMSSLDVMLESQTQVLIHEQEGSFGSVLPCTPFKPLSERRFGP